MRIFLFIILVFFINCKDENSQKNKGTNIEIESNQLKKVNDYLTIIIKTKVSEDDVFEIYFAENLEDNYIPENKVQSIVKGNDVFQEIVFVFPKRVYPLKLRFDLGLKKNETTIKIEEIKLSTGRNNISIVTTEIVKRFRLNKYISYNQETNSFKRKIVNDIYDPLMLSGDLTKEITDVFSE